MKIWSYKVLIREDHTPYLENEMPFIVDGRKCYSKPEVISDFVKTQLKIQDLADEELWVICLDNLLHIFAVFMASRGNSNTTMICTREIFRNALLLNADIICLVHNHPCGDPNPSEEDMKCFKAITNTGKIVGIDVIDSLIVTKESHASSAEILASKRDNN